MISQIIKSQEVHNASGFVWFSWSNPIIYPPNTYMYMPCVALDHYFIFKKKKEKKPFNVIMWMRANRTFYLFCDMDKKEKYDLI